jgi:tetratricopeptide (TPR) repeat protein
MSHWQEVQGWLRSFFRIFSIVALLFYAYIAVRNYRAQCWLQSAELAGIERSASIEPRNAEVWLSLGDHRLALQDPEQALVLLQRAAALDPHDSRIWLDIAVAHHMRADLDAQQRAMDHALTADPHSTVVAWQAAQLAFDEGDTAGALHHLRRIVESDPANTVNALDLAWSATEDLPRITASALPSDTRSFSALLAVLLNHNQFNQIDSLWATAQQQHVANSPEIAITAVNSLLSNHASATAARIWRDLAERPELRGYQSSATNLIVNSGFELELLNNGFDWHIAPRDGVHIQADILSHTGDRSLRLDFDKSVAIDPGISQLIYVGSIPSSTRLTLTFYGRTEDLNARSYLVIEDAESGAALFRTSEIISPNHWKQYSGTFTLRATQLLWVHFVQTPAPALSGHLWLDDFRLSPAQ